MKNGVYQIRNLFNGKRYIGSAAGIGGFIHRWRQHLSLLKQKQHHAHYLQNAWNKHSGSIFVFEILLYCSPEHCLMYEQIMLDHYKPAYNTCPTARNCKGRKYREQTLNKMRQNNIGERNPFYGRTHSVKTCEFLSKIKQGVYLGEKSPCAKLTDKDVRSIKGLLEEKTSRKQISQQFAISLTTISDIVTGTRWSHI